MTIDSICYNCGLYKYSDNPQIQGKGSDKPKLVLIGEAPGPDEAKQGEVFVGRAGKRLDKMIQPYLDLGIWITNAVKCFPPISINNPEKGFRVPKQSEIEYCSHLLWPELNLFNPTPVLMPMGNTALKAVFDNTNSKISSYIGYKFWCTVDNKTYTVIPNYHPSYTLRNPKMEQQFINVMEMAKEYINANSGTASSRRHGRLSE